MNISTSSQNGIITININGKYKKVKGTRISMDNSKVYVDEKEVDMTGTDLTNESRQVVNVTIEGGITGNIQCRGDVEIQGNVRGDVKATGSVAVFEHVTGHINATGNVTTGKHQGNILCTGNVTMKK